MHLERAVLIILVFPPRSVQSKGSGQGSCTVAVSLFDHYLQFLKPETKRQTLRNRKKLNRINYYVYDRK